MATFTQSSASRTITRQSSTIDAVGNVQLTLAVLDVNGVLLETRVVRIPADGSAIVDTLGNQIAASVPTALGLAITAFTTQLDASISAAATGGKFNR